jgi:methylenetetrahydrofolate dehydrogenase (NADP+)/methenyltetrahydrofolate cyclohydrolase
MIGESLNKPVIVDGRAIAADILVKTRERLQSLGGEVVMRAITMSPTPATESYLRMKSARAEDAGMRLELVRMPDDSTSEEVIAAVRAPGADAVLVQLPLPETESISPSLILDEIPLEKDADVLSARAYEDFAYQKDGALLPPVIAAVREVLLRHVPEFCEETKMARAVIVGSGKLVGQPAAVWLEQLGFEIEILTRKSESLEPLKHADLVILGAGSPHLIRPEMLKEGVVLIDAGTSESNGAIVGDADPACAGVARVFTPVPGGIGPIAVACLFQNAAELVLRVRS